MIEMASIIPPVITPATKPGIATDALATIDPDVLEDSYVYVHCRFSIPGPGMLIRIWKTTYLQDCHSSSRSKLIHVENISYAPQWTLIPDKGSYTFLLIFEALPKPCTLFDLIEDIHQPGGFLVKGIQRNKKDVYHIDIS